MKPFDPSIGPVIKPPRASSINAARKRWRADGVTTLVCDIREALLREPVLTGYREGDDAIRAVEEGVKGGDPYGWSSGGAIGTVLHEGRITAEFGYSSGPAVWEAWERVRQALTRRNIIFEMVNSAVSCVYPA